MGKMLREVKWDNKLKWCFKRVNRTFQTGVGYHTDYEKNEKLFKLEHVSFNPNNGNVRAKS